MARPPTVSAQHPLIVHLAAPTYFDEDARNVIIAWVIRSSGPVEHTDVHWDLSSRGRDRLAFAAAGEEIAIVQGGDAGRDQQTDQQGDVAVEQVTFSTFMVTLEIPATASAVYFRIRATVSGTEIWSSQRSITEIPVAESVPDAEAAVAFVEAPSQGGPGSS